MRRMTRDRFLSDAELEKFIGAVRARPHAHRDRNVALFVLLANTGLRPSEALAVRRMDVHLGREPWVRVIRLKKRRPDHDDLQIPAVAADALRAHLGGQDGAPSDLVFSITRRQAERLFHGYMGRAGLRRRCLYSLRHTAATRLYRATRDIQLVQAILGHEKPDTTAIYAHLPRAILRELADSQQPVI